MSASLRVATEGWKSTDELIHSPKNATVILGRKKNGGVARMDIKVNRNPKE
jgi:hypothetical protein